MAKQQDFSHFNTPSFRAGLERWAEKYRADNPSPLWDLGETPDQARMQREAAQFDRAFASLPVSHNGGKGVDLLASAPPVRGSAGWDEAFGGVGNPFNKQRER